LSTALSRPVRVPSLIVIGGGDVGAVAVRQILRACAAERLLVDRVLIVDRNAACAAATLRGLGGPPGSGRPEVLLEVAPWSSWLEEHLGAASPDDHLVPYHWAPHLLLDWLAAEVRRAGGRLARQGTVAPRGMLYEAPTSGGDRALSHAAWMCPPLCIEPELCPHTGGPRHWSLAQELVGVEPRDEVDAAIVFPCLHLTDGVGTVPVALVHAAARRLTSGLARGEQSYVVATASHCHGLAARVVVARSP
jgi:hypothetical protein